MLVFCCLTSMVHNCTSFTRSTLAFSSNSSSYRVFIDKIDFSYFAKMRQILRHKKFYLNYIFYCRSYICELFGGFGDKQHSSVTSLKMDAGSASLKRGSSLRKTWSSTSAAAAVKKSMCMIAKFQTVCWRKEIVFRLLDIISFAEVT